jgi:DNA-binding CsgD family transcriptional regulator
LPALPELDAAVATLRDEIDPVRIMRLGIAAGFVDRLSGCREALRRVVRQGRDSGGLILAVDAMFLLASDAFTTGDWNEVLRLADEGIELCETHGYPVLAWSGFAQKALVAAARGHDDEMRALTDTMIGWAAPRGVRSVQLLALHARALGALGRGDFEGAYHHAAAISPAGQLAPHVPHALWLVMDLVEAAVRTGRHAAAAAHVAAAREANIPKVSSRLGLLTFGAAAIAAPDDEVRMCCEVALGVSGGDRWPFDLARVQLLCGERLRRAQATSEAREHLTAARDTFERLGARPWAARAANELRATGVSTGRPDALGPGSLTPQELEIARLAAAGLTNKEIGERLFLSHRTVGTHLYQLFPKLGITSRAALRDALESPPAH